MRKRNGRVPVQKRVGRGVRVVCGRCRRKLADLYPFSRHDQSVDAFTNGRGDGRRWLCDRCGADWQVEALRWLAAYQSAGERGVITLPLSS